MYTNIVILIILSFLICVVFFGLPQKTKSISKKILVEPVDGKYILLAILVVSWLLPILYSDELSNKAGVTVLFSLSLFFSLKLMGTKE